ncbi:LPD7 domain-containing protein [Burkholderia ubonensis]|uniref:LPD7 domain-containing protein n=1 Tax=Burkholderia ubonensis TaxID=101571 RepID=UPI000B03BD3B|nr:LPD7 domain-containing protein [Burkholderia ubonensis]
MNTIDVHSPELVRERADALRAELSSLDWRNDKEALNKTVDDLRDLASLDWYAAADVWRESRTDAPMPDFIDPETDIATEFRHQAADMGIHRALEGDPEIPGVQVFEPEGFGEAANEPSAKEASNEPAKPTLERLQATDLDRVKAARRTDRKAAEALLQERAALARSVGKERDNSAPSPAVAADRNEDDARTTDGPEGKPVFAKTGYSIPKRVASQYHAHEGKFYDRKSESVHFEDKGKALSTESNDRQVIAHMVDVAKAKNWTVLEVRGSEEFRRNAWIAAQLAGVELRGFVPKENDRALLELARQEMRINGGERDNANTIQQATGPSIDRTDPAAANQPAPAEPSKASTADADDLVRKIREERDAALRDDARSLAQSHANRSPADLDRRTWVLAQLAGMEVSGYVPDDQARELLAATRRELGNPATAAARKVMEQKIDGQPATVQQRVRADFNAAAVDAASKGRALNVPAPQATRATVEQARRAFFERGATQPAQSQPTQSKSDPGMEISR